MSDSEENEPMLKDDDDKKDWLLSSGDNRSPRLKNKNDAGFYGSTSTSDASTSIDGPPHPNYHTHVETETYWYRWYILALFSLLAMNSNISWNTWGPIETSARAAYGFSGGTISLLSDWGAITFILAVFPSSYMLDVLGLRKATIVAGLCLLVGNVLRCILTFKQSNHATILIHAGQIFIGLCGPVGQAAATALSSTWFPPNQRTTATAIGSLASYCGTALSFMLGPHLVNDIDDCGFKPGTAGYKKHVDIIGHQIMNYLYLECGIVGTLVLLILVSFPAKPPKPPSATANAERIDFKDGIIKLLKNPQFQLIAFAYGLSTGVYSAWCSDLALNLKSFGINDSTAGMFGFWAVIAGSVSGIALSILGDSLGALKLMLMLLFVVATASFSIFSLVCMKVIPSSMALYYMTCICGGLTVNGSIPLFFELAVESSYPVAEGVNTGFMTFSNNVYCTIFLSIPLIHGVGTQWMNWFLVASCVLVIPTMLLFKERYRRLELDLIDKRFDQDESMKYPGLNGSSSDYKPIV